MNVISYPLRYLLLRSERGGLLCLRDKFALLFFTAALSFPFVFADVNFFGDKGFLDRVGGFVAVLSGFYIAALVGVASFSTALGDLDDIIEVGRIGIKDEQGELEYLTRRQYVCSIFGYLSFLSLFVSVFGIVSIVIAGTKDVIRRFSFFGSNPIDIDGNTFWYTRAFVIFVFCAIFSHMIITTFHGLFYLIDRLYVKKPVTLKKSEKVNLK